MKYIIRIKDGYIISIGTGNRGNEITEAKYNQILNIIRHKPPETETIDYRLRTDLTWEECEKQPQPEEL